MTYSGPSFWLENCSWKFRFWFENTNQLSPTGDTKQGDSMGSDKAPGEHGTQSKALENPTSTKASPHGETPSQTELMNK